MFIWWFLAENYVNDYNIFTHIIWPYIVYKEFINYTRKVIDSYKEKE